MIEQKVELGKWISISLMVSDPFFEATSMLVTDVGNGLWWWLTTGDNFEMLVTNWFFTLKDVIYTGKDVTNKIIHSPTSCHKIATFRKSPTWRGYYFLLVVKLKIIDLNYSKSEVGITELAILLDLIHSK